MRILGTILLISALAACSFAKVAETFEMGTPPRSGLAGNNVSDIAAGNGVIWFGSGYGLSRTTDQGQTFESFGPEHGIGNGSISALWAHGDTVLVATANDTLTAVSNDYLDNGTGLSISFDGGDSWEHIPQPPGDYTTVQNLSYDIAVVDSTIWLANFGAGLVRGDGFGQRWEIATPDTFPFNPGANLNHRAFSAINADGVLWVGTAKGVNKSTDNGLTWVNFNATNQSNPISGDFVNALAYQKADGKKIIWASTWKAEGTDEYYAVSKTENGGATWQTMLHDIRPANFSFDGKIVYVATYDGLYKSDDFGENWYKFPPITDTITGDHVYTSEYYSVYADNGTVWVGTSDGLARSSDNGYTWDVNRAYKPTGQDGVPRVYAYPNPFSSTRTNLVGDDGHVRLQYNTTGSTYVTVRIFDFAMDLVTTVADNKYVSTEGDHNEVWNGRNDYGDLVANGVYFFSVELENEGTFWGKIMIVN